MPGNESCPNILSDRTILRQSMPQTWTSCCFATLVCKQQGHPTTVACVVLGSSGAVPTRLNELLNNDG